MPSRAEIVEYTPNNPKEEAKDFFRESLLDFSGQEVSEENMRDLALVVNGAHGVLVNDQSMSLFWYWLNNDGTVQVTIATFDREEESRLTVSKTIVPMRNVEIKPYKRPENLGRERVNLSSVEFSDSSIYFLGDNKTEIEFAINEAN